MHRHINISMLQALKWIIHDNWGTGDFIITFKTSTSNPFLCAADFFLKLGSCKEAAR